jgi:hypothetical protein
MSTLFGIFAGSELGGANQYLPSSQNNNNGTVVDLSNYVTLNTTQNITGQKTFTNVDNTYYGTFIGELDGFVASSTIAGSLTVVPESGGAAGYITAAGDIISATQLSAPQLLITDDAQIDGQLTVTNIVTNEVSAENGFFDALQCNNLEVTQRICVNKNTATEAIDVDGNIKINTSGNGIVFPDGSKLESANFVPVPGAGLTGTSLQLTTTNNTFASPIVSNHLASVNASLSSNLFNVYEFVSSGTTYNYYVPQSLFEPEINSPKLTSNADGSGGITTNIYELSYAGLTCPNPATGNYDEMVFTTGPFEPPFTLQYGYMMFINGEAPVFSWDTKVNGFVQATGVVYLSKPALRRFTGKTVTGRVWRSNAYFFPNPYTLYVSNYPTATHFEKNYAQGFAENNVILKTQHSVTVTNSGYDNNLNGLVLNCPNLGRDQFELTEYFGDHPVYSRHNVGYTILFSGSALTSTNGISNNFGNPKNVLTFYLKDSPTINTNHTQFQTMSNGVWLLAGYAQMDDTTPYMTGLKLSWGDPVGGTLLSKSNCLRNTNSVAYPTNLRQNETTDLYDVPYPTAIVVMTNNGINTNITPNVEARITSGAVYITFVITATRIA